MDSIGIKPNYAALGRKYDLDWRTVKKYHNGYKGKPSSRKKGSKLDPFKDEIREKLSIKRVTVKGVYEFMVKKHGVGQIGCYSNFCDYIIRKKLKDQKPKEGHPRYETGPGVQGQVDWKEDITLHSKNGETVTINIFHLVLGFSDFSHIVLSIRKRIDDVERCMIECFREFGGIPEELLFDNMPTVVTVNGREKKLTSAIKGFAADFGFKVRTCATRSPETKGTVEARNKILDWIRPYDGEFETIEDLLAIVKEINTDMNLKINDATGMTPVALFYKEKEYLHPLPEEKIIEEYLFPNKFVVNNDSMIRYGNCRYSVDPKLINEEVSVDVLEDKLYIYYKGKLNTVHEIKGKPLNYKEDHYTKLMQTKVSDEKLADVVQNNLRLMDSLLESRTVKVSPIEASRSADALIAFINQSRYGRWVIERYAHLPLEDRITIIKGLNQVLPYVKDSESDLFISKIRFSLERNMCKTIDFDCLTDDLLAYSEEECVLTKEGFDVIKKKYEAELDDFINDMRAEEQKKTEKENNRKKEGAEDFLLPPMDVDEELPFE